MLEGQSLGGMITNGDPTYHEMTLPAFSGTQCQIESPPERGWYECSVIRSCQTPALSCMILTPLFTDPIQALKVGGGYRSRKDLPSLNLSVSSSLEPNAQTPHKTRVTQFL